jgi:3-dehydroquinate dehydratase-2
MTLDDLNGKIQALADELGDVELEFFQSNHEGAIIDLLQQRHGSGLAGCILNPGGLTHSSVSLHDTVQAVDYPVLEVHISNIHAREAWRRHSFVAPAASGSLIGLGWRGYLHALRHLVALVREGA